MDVHFDWTLDVYVLGGIGLPMLSVALVGVAFLAKKNMRLYLTSLGVISVLSLALAVFWLVAQGGGEGGPGPLSPYAWHSYWTWPNQIGWFAVGLSVLIALVRRERKHH